VDLCELSSSGAELPAKWRGSEAAGMVRFGALLAGEFKPGVRRCGLDLSVSFPYRQLVLSLALQFFLRMLIWKKKKPNPTH